MSAETIVKKRREPKERLRGRLSLAAISMSNGVMRCTAVCDSRRSFFVLELTFSIYIFHLTTLHKWEFRRCVIVQCITLHDITSLYFTSHLIRSRHVMSIHVTSRHLTMYYITSRNSKVLSYFPET